MISRTHGVVLTYDDLLHMPDDRNRYELFEGVLEVTPAPGTGHQIAVLNLAVLLAGHVRRRRLGKVFVAPCDVLLSNTSVVEPDLFFVAREGRAAILPRYVQGPPDLVVEVLSPSTAQRDQGAKRQLYAAFGVPHYWVLDPQARQVTAYVLESGEYRQTAVARGDEQLAAPPFPDLVIPLAELWD